MKIYIPRFLVQQILFISKFINENHFLLVCKGYNEDYSLYTGLYWDDDKDIDFYDKSYNDFQLWINIYKQNIINGKIDF